MWDALFGIDSRGYVPHEMQLLRLLVFVGLSLAVLLGFILRALHRLVEQNDRRRS